MPKSKHRKKKHKPARSSRDERIDIIRRVSHFPLRECLISEEWSKSGLAHIIFARNRPDNQVAIGVFMVDIGCLGVKSAFANPAISLAQYDQMLRSNPEKMARTDPACAVKLILGALDYAKRLDFKPDPDYYYAREIFGDIDPESCEEIFEYGRDGKPFYFSGPHDNVNRIINQLRRKVGPDGFDYVAMIGPFDGDEVYEDEDEEIEN
ncbi:MAG: hypothetical protein AB1631_08235 [Acidobacteriota bacterium]